MPENPQRRDFLLKAGALGVGAAAASAVLYPQQAAASPADENINGITPQMFGAVADGVNDDTQAIRDALATLAYAPGPHVLYFPPGRYRITDTIVTSEVDAAQHHSLVMVGAGAAGEKSSTIHVDMTQGVGFEIQAQLTVVANLCFVGERVNPVTDCGALRFMKDFNTDDMDGNVHDCVFKLFDTAVDYVGRGLYFQRNAIAKCDVGVAIAWPQSGTEPGAGSPVHLPPYGMRKWIITDNHFHTLGLAIQVTKIGDEIFRGAVIANNLMDIGRGFFRGDISNSLISGNVVENANSTPIVISSGGRNVTITGNVLGGYEFGPVIDPGHDTYQPVSAIIVQQGAQARYMSITGNAFKWTKLSPVTFKSNVQDITISSNTFTDWSVRDGVVPARVDDACIRAESGATRMSIVGNIFSPNPAPQGAMVRVEGTLASSALVGNSWDKSQDLLWADAVNDVEVQQ